MEDKVFVGFAHLFLGLFMVPSACEGEQRKQSWGDKKSRESDPSTGRFTC